MASKTQNKQRTEANTTPTVKFLVSSFRMKLEDQSIDYSWCRQRWRVILLRKINELTCPTIFLSMLSICQSVSPSIHQLSISHSVCQSFSLSTSLWSDLSQTRTATNLSASPLDGFSQTVNLSVCLCFSQPVNQSIHQLVSWSWAIGHSAKCY